MLRLLTAGESHGKCLVAIIDGLPAGLKIDTNFINSALKKRQSGYGRGGRMQIERDRVEILSGVRKHKTLGSPMAVLIKNKDSSIDKLHSLFCPRPGHADFSGALKFNEPDMRNILERASARETAVRTAVGAICQLLLREFGVEIIHHVTAIGGESINPANLSPAEIKIRSSKSALFCADAAAENLMKKNIDLARMKGDTVGGVFEIIVTNLLPGLGSYTQFDQRLTSRIAAALFSIPAIKGVEFGLGFAGAAGLGSRVHDALYYSPRKGFYHSSNNSGGIEGGMTNGENIIVRCAMKPISTLLNPLDSVDLRTGHKHKAAVERSDICAVPAASVVGAAMVAYEIALAFSLKFGGDSLGELKANYANYLKTVKAWPKKT